MRTHAIYKLFCTVSGKAYFGRTCDLTRRKREHLGALALGAHKNPHLQAAYDLRGGMSFRWVVVCEGLTEAAARDFEQSMFDALWDCDTLYNLAKSSEGGGYKGRVVSEVTRKRMSDSRKVYLANPAVRQNLRQKHLGKVLSAEHRQKLCVARRATVQRKAQQVATA